MNSATHSMELNTGVNTGHPFNGGLNTGGAIRATHFAEAEKSLVDRRVHPRHVCGVGSVVRIGAWGVGAAAILIILASITLRAWVRIEQPYRFYPEHAAAMAAGEVTRGWLPEWVPREAWSLHIQGDLDTNRWWFRFSLDDASAGRLKAKMTPIPDPQVAQVVAVSSPAYGDWWFEALIQQHPPNDGALNADHFIFELDRRLAHVAFERHGSEVYCWGKE